MDRMNITGNAYLLLLLYLLFCTVLFCMLQLAHISIEISIIGIAIIVERKITNRYLVYDV